MIKNINFTLLIYCAGLFIPGYIPLFFIFALLPKWITNPIYIIKMLLLNSWLFFSMAIYAVIELFNGVDFGLSRLVAIILLPISYVIGRITSLIDLEGRSFIVNYLMISFYSSIIVIYSIVGDILSHGFVNISNGRSIDIVGLGPMMSATVVGAYLLLPSTGIALFILLLGRKDTFTVKAFALAMWMLALICAFRLGSRTILFVSLVSIFFGLFFSKRYLAVVFLLFIGASVAYLLVGNAEEISILNYYADRINNDEAGISSGGGRFELWWAGMSKILDHPGGWLFEHGERYAHNLWIDAARQGGWFGFLFMFVIAILSFVNLIRIWKSNCMDSSVISMLIIIFMSFYFIFMLEPIMDGFLGVFSLFLFYSGYIAKTSKIQLGINVTKTGGQLH